MTNPLLDPPGLPRFSDIKAEHVVPAIREHLARLDQNRLALEARVSPSWDTVEALIDLTEPLGSAWGVVNHLMGVRNSEALREAHQTVQGETVMAMVQLAQNETFHHALTGMKEDAARWQALSAAQRRVVELRLLDARLSGMMLKGPARERFNEIEQQLSDLQTRFANHVLDATKAFALTLHEAEEVAGLPHSLLQLAAQAAHAAGEASATAEKGPWRFTLDLPSFGPFLKHALRRDLREKMYRAYVSRASSGAHDNTPLITQLLDLRAEKARLLGFGTYAELSLASKMAPSVPEVERLLEELRLAAWPAAERDLEELRALSPDGKVELWDVDFLSERLREKRFDFTEEELRPYFPLPRVLSGLFGLANRLFGITVKEAPGKASVWHPDVQYFQVFSENGAQVASFFLDPYSRPEDKRGGAWVDECLTRRKRPDWKETRLPVAYVTCNQTPPVGGRPSLMTFREVETLFHEFGHALQLMLTTVDCADVSGFRGVEWDAVELPSQFMENWCYHQDTLLGLSGHVETGQPLPEALFKKLHAARTFRAGSMTLRQLYFALTDLELHHRYNSDLGRTVFDVQRQVAQKTTVLPPLVEDRFLCGFTHIFAGGYAAGYYSYKWAEVLSADAFGAFEEAGLDNAQARTATGHRFRDTVLALGGSVHPMDVFKAFRGRAPSTEALLRHSGLSGATRPTGRT